MSPEPTERDRRGYTLTDDQFEELMVLQQQLHQQASNMALSEIDQRLRHILMRIYGEK